MEQKVAENLFQQNIGPDYESVEMVENGDLVNTYIFEHDPNYVLQFPRFDSRGFDLGLSIYENLESSEIPVPEVIDRRYGEDSYAVLEYLQGDDLNNIEDPKDHLFYQAGQVLADIHQEYEFDGYGYISRQSLELPSPSRDWRMFFQARTGSRIDDLRGKIIDISEASSLERKIASGVPRKPESALLHNDYAGRNIRVGSDLEAIMDFDSCFVGDPDFDFVKARENFKRDFGENEALSFEKGYRDNKELGENFEAKETAYMVSELTNEAWALRQLTRMGRRKQDKEEIEDLVSSALKLC